MVSLTALLPRYAAWFPVVSCPPAGAAWRARTARGVARFVGCPGRVAAGGGVFAVSCSGLQFRFLASVAGRLVTVAVGAECRGGVVEPCGGRRLGAGVDRVAADPGVDPRLE